MIQSTAVPSIAMSATITEDMEGKDVVDSDGTRIGMISDVRHGTAYVDPDPGITEKIKASLGWEEAEAEDYPLQESSIATVTEDEIRLQPIV